MSVTRHKTQQGLLSYERPKSIMQHEAINGFVKAMKIIGKSSNRFKGMIYI